MLGKLIPDWLDVPALQSEDPIDAARLKEHNDEFGHCPLSSLRHEAVLRSSGESTAP